MNGVLRHRALFATSCIRTRSAVEHTEALMEFGLPAAHKIIIINGHWPDAGTNAARSAHAVGRDVEDSIEQLTVRCGRLSRHPARRVPPERACLSPCASLS